MREATFSKESLLCGDSHLKYWLYIPENATENMPLIVYLHGGSGKGDDPDALTRHEGFPQFVQNKLLKAPAFIVIPQAPEYVHGWDELNDELLLLIEEISDKYRIARDNVSLTGHSMGGIGAWMVGCHNQKIFARIAPVSGSVGRRMSRFADRATLPVWSFVGSDISDARAYDSNTEFFPRLVKHNPNATLTVLNGYGHRDTVRAYLEYDIIGWLIGKDCI